MRRFVSFFFLSAFCLGLAGSASANTFVRGDVDIDAKTGNVVTVAIGAHSEADTTVASIGENTRLYGDVDIKTQSRDLITIAGGRGADAETRIGSIGK